MFSSDDDKIDDREEESKTLNDNVAGIKAEGRLSPRKSAIYL